MAKRRLPEINAASMADIAFQLLIFFIVTTTLDTDSGIFRILPPMPETEDQIQQEEIKKRNIFVVLVNRENQLLVQNEQMNIRYLRSAAKEFIDNPSNQAHLPEKILTDIDLLGPFATTKYHVISLQNDRGTSYETYIAVQNELTAAYNDLKDEMARRRFNIAYADLGEDDTRKRAIDQVYPLRISEAEPRDIGGQ